MIIERTLMCAFCVCVLATCGLAFLFTQFAHPAADDFCRAGAARTYGIFGAIAREYLTWDGRWAANALMFTLSRSADITRVYNAALAVIMSIWITAAFCLVSAVFSQIGVRSRIVLTAGLFAIYWTGAPSPPDVLYWLTGAFENALSVAVGMVLLASLISLRAEVTRTRSVVRAVMLAGLAFFAVGFHELFGCILVFVLAAGSSVAFLRGSPSRLTWLAAFLAAGAGFAVVYFAPGNAIRAAHFPETGRLLRSVLLARFAAKQAIGDWILDERLLLATAAFFLFVSGSGVDSIWPEINGRHFGWVSLAIWLVVLGLSFWAPSWSTGHEITARTLTGVYTLFLIGWFLAAFLLAMRYRALRCQRNTSQSPWLAVCCCLFGFSLLVTGNVPHAIRDVWSGAAPEYDHAMRARYSEIRIALSQDRQELSVERPHRYPAMCGKYDITEDASDWNNVCVAKFFGLRSIAIASSERLAGDISRASAGMSGSPCSCSQAER